MKVQLVKLTTIFTIMLIGCGQEKKEQPVTLKAEKSINPKVQEELAVISTQFGDMIVEFYKRAAPKHVESFKLHAKNGFYDGTIFHRVIPGFMIQGGDPNTKGEDVMSYGMGGHAAKFYGFGDEKNMNSWKLPAEFNDIKHTKGILSMARSNDKNSAGSQFFICDGNPSHLNAQYTVFGKVIEGLDIIDKIAGLPRDNRNNPLKRIDMKIRLKPKNL